MSEAEAGNELPEVALLLGIDSSLSRAIDIDDPLNKAIRQEISRRLAEVLEALGIPGIPAVQIVALRTDPMGSGQFLRVQVNGQLLRYPDELLRLVYGYVNGSHPDPDMKLSEILAWLSEVFDDRSETADVSGERVGEFLSLVCMDIVKRQPAVLLGLEQVVAYMATLPCPSDESNLRSHPLFQDSTRLRTILREALNLKISIADKQLVTTSLWQAWERSTEDVIEDLVVALCPDNIEIQLPWEYLRQMTSDNAKDGPSMFPYLREGLFQELGSTYPEFRFAIVEELKPNCIAFKINHLTTTPLMGLRSDQCLVNDTESRLSVLKIEAKATINPATGKPSSLIDLSDKDLAESHGLTTWDQMGYLILSFAAVLRKNSACFTHLEAVQAQLDQLESAFPALVKAARTQASNEQITRVLRALVAEEISIRNLRLILERMLDYDYGFSDSTRYLILDDRPTSYGQLDAARRSDLFSLVSFVRAGMKRQIGNKYAGGTNTLVAYLLDLQIEQILLGNQSLQAGENGEAHLAEGVYDKILEAIRQEIAMLPPTAMTPSILTSIDVRPSLRQVIASEFPRLPVVAYQELAPDLNIQPVARISLNT